MNTGAELGQYFCANAVKNIHWRLYPFNSFWVCQCSDTWMVMV